MGKQRRGFDELVVQGKRVIFLVWFTCTSFSSGNCKTIFSLWAVFSALQLDILQRDWGAGRLLQQLWPWRKPSISLTNFTETGYFLNCWRILVMVRMAAVNYDPVRTGLMWTPPNEFTKPMSEAAVSLHGRMSLMNYNSHLKTTEINRAFNSGHRSAGTPFSEASSLKGSLGINLVSLWSMLWI